MTDKFDPSKFNAKKEFKDLKSIEPVVDYYKSTTDEQLFNDFDIFTESFEDYCRRFNSLEKVDKFKLDNEIRYFNLIKRTSDYARTDFHWDNKPTAEELKVINIEINTFFDRNSSDFDATTKRVYELAYRIEDFLIEAFESLKNPKTTDKPKEQKTIDQPSLKDFFTDSVEASTIELIQSKFKDLENKNLAILIYLLKDVYKLITIDNNRRKQSSRIFFVKCLKNDFTLKHISGVNKYFTVATDKGNMKDFTIPATDTDYLDIKNELDATLKSI